jgi:hypothetical protein
MEFYGANTIQPFFAIGNSLTNSYELLREWRMARTDILRDEL